MLTRLSLSFTAALLLAGFVTTSSARAQGSDGDAELAGAKFLVEEKGLATGKAPAEQWFAIYAGPCWTSAGSMTVTESDKDAGGLRRIDVAKIDSRDRHPQQELESWWIDASGATVRGERKVYEDKSEKPNQWAKYELKGGKIKMTFTSQEEGEAPKTEVADDADLPASFVPHYLLAVVLVPQSDKVKTWKFSSFAPDGYLPFTVTDMGAEKVKSRSAEVTAHKLVVKNKDGEAAYWVDADRRIVAQRWPTFPNVLGISGTAEESRQDWLSRPTDDADAAADKALAGAASLEKLAGDLVYGVYDKHGKVKETFAASLKKEDGKYHYVGTTADTADVGTGSTVEEWTIAPDGAPISGSIVHDPAGDKKTSTAKIEGGKIMFHDVEEPERDKSLPVFPRLVAPDALFVVRALAKSDTTGILRFAELDITTELPFSVWIELVGTEKVRLRGGEADCKHYHLTQNTAEAHCWIDAQGNFVLKWNDGEQYISGTADEVKKDVSGKFGGGKKEVGDDE